jgi:hypothetical protein
MKKSIFSLLFLAVSAFSFYQCQKDTTNQNSLTPENQQVIEERGPGNGGLNPCPVTVTGDMNTNVCGTDIGAALCTTCTGFNGVGSVNFAANGSVTFTPTTIIFSVRNLGNDTGKYTISNTNGTINFQLAPGGCRDFSMNGCNIF